MESRMVNYVGPMHNSVGQSIQLRYGEDGLAGESVEYQNLPTIKLFNQVFEKRFKSDWSNKRHMHRIPNEGICKELRNPAKRSTTPKHWLRFM